MQELVINPQLLVAESLAVEGIPFPDALTMMPDAQKVVCLEMLQEGIDAFQKAENLKDVRAATASLAWITNLVAVLHGIDLSYDISRIHQGLVYHGKEQYA